ncbi:Gfo/Idh/MocA family oxidoreductase [Nocardioides sp. zg-1308]|uniref:Gfo/Idh/MocA family oxidoreductase n=1 Tax=Nocardioides renjunii TaxID=3095075 RepID=A0ABU5KCZ0_9ACTN|nr:MULTISPECIES: Gfo/Idh/MocA family oxidoreductase [unclassified Nocardioides]MDZ5662821.1 Gfo/Idh/MocA family oxidoreductase [Nocardioides sp. S-58]NPD05510.1 Gfo/Idh/MocA family oxidoreductase [Nocardioides sp. zg-1308]
MTTRWGIAATGGMAAAFATDLALVPDAELAFVGSRSPGSAADFADRFGAAASGTHRDLLDAGARGEVDVVYIATPHPQHHALALAAVEAGTALLVEKAFTATLAGAEEVVAAARAAEVFCMEAMWTRFQPALRHARDLVAGGAIGDVLLVQADFGAFREYDPGNRLFDLALGGGAVLDLGVYPISLAQHFLGRPDRVTATGTTYPNGADRSAAIQLSWADGRAASLTCSLASATPGRALLVGTEGTLELVPPFHHPSRVVVRRNGQEAEEVELPPTGTGYVHQVEEVQRCLAAGLTESPVMPLADTLDVQWVLEECLGQLGITMVEATVDLEG